MKKLFSLTLLSFITISIFSQEEVCDKKLKKDKKSEYNIADSVQTNYNFKKNKESYQITFLEFGMTTCIPCRKMKVVMHEIDSIYKGKVKVIFHNVIKQPAKAYADYYNIELVPVQILLDKEGKQFYKHEGFIPTKEIAEIIEKKLKK